MSHFVLEITKSSLFPRWADKGSLPSPATTKNSPWTGHSPSLSLSCLPCQMQALDLAESKLLSSCGMLGANKKNTHTRKVPSGLSLFLIPNPQGQGAFIYLAVAGSTLRNNFYWWNCIENHGKEMSVRYTQRCQFIQISFPVEIDLMPKNISVSGYMSIAFFLMKANNFPRTCS